MTAWGKWARRLQVALILTLSIFGTTQANGRECNLSDECSIPMFDLLVKKRRRFCATLPLFLMFFVSPAMADDNCLAFHNSLEFERVEAIVEEGLLGEFEDIMNREFIGRKCSSNEMIELMTLLGFSSPAVSDRTSRPPRSINGSDFNLYISFCKRTKFPRNLLKRCGGMAALYFLDGEIVYVISGGTI